MEAMGLENEDFSDENQCQCMYTWKFFAYISVVENRVTQDTFQSLKVNFFFHFYIPFFYIFET